MKFRKRMPEVEAITFDELVEHGKQSGGPLVNGMPWSFEYQGRPVTHETDSCYIVLFLGETVRFNRGEMLVTDENGNTFPVSTDRFNALYESAGPDTCPTCGAQDGGTHGEPPYSVCPQITGRPVESLVEWTPESSRIEEKYSPGAVPALREGKRLPYGK